VIVAASTAVVLALAAPAAGVVAESATPPGADAQLPAVVIAVPDLRWSDLTYMPRLRAFAETAAVGDLSVKTAHPQADCNDGMLTFSAGNRADTDVPGCSMTAPQLAKARHDAAGSDFDAHVGALGDALRAGGFETVAVDKESITLLADSKGEVFASPYKTVLLGGEPAVDAIVDDDLYVGRADQRATTATRLDGKIDGQIAELPPRTTVIIAGLSDAPTGHAHLHVLLIRHPGWKHVELARPSTRPPYVALIDLAPTLLQLLGRAPPSDLAGRVLHPTSTPARDWSTYADQDLHAQSARAASKPLRYTLAIATLAILVLLVLAAWRRDGEIAGALAGWLGRLAVGVPVFAFLIQRVPWWRSSGLVVAAMFVGAAIVFTVVVTAVLPQRTEVPLLIVPAITAIVLLADQLAGAPLQLSAPLGDNPLIGGRFHGMGNIDFALFATCAVLCAAVTGGLLVSHGRRSLGLAVAGAIGVLALVVDGAPPLGDDAGGAVTLLTAVLLMLAVLAGVRISWRRALVVLVVAVVAVLLVGVADHARGPGAQTHLGRFIGQLLQGGAGTDVRRRLSAVGRSFGNVPLTLLVVAAVALALVARDFLRRRASAVAGLPAALAGIATVAVLGTLLNDSGVVVASFALIVTVAAMAGAGVLTAPAAGSTSDQAG
jgi:hypothetical protein